MRALSLMLWVGLGLLACDASRQQFAEEGPSNSETDEPVDSGAGSVDTTTTAAADETEQDDVASDDDEMEQDDTASDETASDEAPSDETTADETEQDDTASDEASNDETATDETASDEAPSDETAAGDAENPLSQGDACTEDDECSSGSCQDGYCCDTACDGQCESCGVAGNLGTCLPVTTPRSNCGGIGVCAGYCDGTPENRAACVFPGSATTCGAAASCSDGELTSAATCDGAGACAERTTTSCMFGCRSDGEMACASMCSSDQDLCDGSCVDTESDPNNCGSSCQECGGATAICASGECVECEVTGDCTGSGVTCTGEGTCECGAGYHACGASRNPCYSDTDVSHCGEGCIDCRQPNANAACGVDNACANTCNDAAYTLSCPAVGGKPNCSQWDFETGTDGWQLEALDASADASAGPLAISTFDSVSGTHSLAIPFNNNNQDDDRFVSVRVQLCAGGNVLDLSDKHLRWSFRMDPVQDGGYNFLQVYNAPNFGGGGGLFDFNTDADGEWDSWDYALADYGTTFEQVTAIGFHIQATQNYIGVIYLDDIRIY